jgi:flagellar protein FlbD
MIRLTRLNRLPVVLNSDLIEHIDETPDTVIMLTTGQILRVRETVDEVLDRILEFRRKIHQPEWLLREGLRASETVPRSGEPELPE